MLVIARKRKQSGNISFHLLESQLRTRSKPAKQTVHYERHLDDRPKDLNRR